MKISHKLFSKTLLACGAILCMSTAIAEADVTHDVISTNDCSTRSDGITYCLIRDTTVHRVTTPSGNTIIKDKGVRTITKAYGDSEPFSTYSFTDNYTGLIKQGEEHIFNYTYVEDTCFNGLQTIMTSVYRYINGQAVKSENSSFEEIPC